MPVSLGDIAPPPTRSLGIDDEGGQGGMDDVIDVATAALLNVLFDKPAPALQLPQTRADPLLRDRADLEATRRANSLPDIDRDK
jgi:hypothetical protein